MTDLEMTKLCAEAMGYKLVYPDESYLPVCIEGKFGAGTFSPLHDDAQAMALVKRFKPHIEFSDRDVKVWLPQARTKELDYQPPVVSQDLNRAIVECVAKMQKAK